MELDTRTKAYIQMLTNQRNRSQDAIAQLAAEIAGRQEELAAAKAPKEAEVPKC